MRALCYYAERIRQHNTTTCLFTKVLSYHCVSLDTIGPQRHACSGRSSSPVHSRLSHLVALARWYPAERRQSSRICSPWSYRYCRWRSGRGSCSASRAIGDCYNCCDCNTNCVDCLRGGGWDPAALRSCCCWWNNGAGCAVNPVPMVWPDKYY